MSTRQPKDPHHLSRLLVTAESLRDQAFPVEPVLRALNDFKVLHVLVGGHAVGPLTGNPRNTRDVDIVVADLDRAHQAIAHHFPHLIKMDNRGEDVTRYQDPDELDEDRADCLNLLHPSGYFLAQLTHSQPVTFKKQQTRLPTRPALLAAKAVSYFSPNRDMVGKARDYSDMVALAHKHVKEGGGWEAIEFARSIHPVGPIDREIDLVLRDLVQRATEQVVA